VGPTMFGESEGRIDQAAKARLWSAHRGQTAGHVDKDPPGTWEILPPPSIQTAGEPSTKTQARGALTPCPARANKANRRNCSTEKSEASGDGGKSERPNITDEAGEPSRGTRRREEGRWVKRTVEGKEGPRCQS